MGKTKKSMTVIRICTVYFSHLTECPSVSKNAYDSAAYTTLQENASRCRLSTTWCMDISHGTVGVASAEGERNNFGVPTSKEGCWISVNCCCGLTLKMYSGLSPVEQFLL